MVRASGQLNDICAETDTFNRRWHDRLVRPKLRYA
jgi:hypothetical protein